MQVLIFGYVNEHGHFRPANKVSRPRPGEIVLRATLDVPDSAFAPTEVRVSVAIPDAGPMTATVKDATLTNRRVPNGPVIPKPEPQHIGRPLDVSTGVWYGRTLLKLMALQDIGYDDMATRLGVDAVTVKKWTNMAGALPITAKQAATLTALVHTEAA
jgi:hypothetical protein